MYNKLSWWLSANAGDGGSVPGSGRSSGEGHGNPLQRPCLGNPMDRGIWQAIVHGFAKELDTTQRLNNSNNGFILLCSRNWHDITAETDTTSQRKPTRRHSRNWHNIVKQLYPSANLKQRMRLNITDGVTANGSGIRISPARVCVVICSVVSDSLWPREL